jgi:hypothetical protein
MKINSINNLSNYTKISKEDIVAKKEGSFVKKDDDTQSPNHLTTAQKEQVIKLQQRDTHVRAHEAAHLAAGGSVVSGGASYTYQKGPDGKMYAVGGEVPIHVTKGSNPKETLSIARQLRAAALAPADPSPQDLKVAASASMMEAKAIQEINQEKIKESNPYNKKDEDKNSQSLINIRT